MHILTHKNWLHLHEDLWVHISNEYAIVVLNDEEYVIINSTGDVVAGYFSLVEAFEFDVT